jgi:hypothetical protein
LVHSLHDGNPPPARGDVALPVFFADTLTWWSQLVIFAAMVGTGHVRAVFVAHAAANGSRCGPFEWLDGPCARLASSDKVLQVGKALRRPSQNVVAASKIVASHVGAEAAAQLCYMILGDAATAMGTTAAALTKSLVHKKVFEIGPERVEVESIPVPTAVGFRPTHIKLPPRSSVVGNAVPGSIIVVMATPKYSILGARSALALHGHNHLYPHAKDVFSSAKTATAWKPVVTRVIQSTTLRHPGPSGNKVLAVATVR